MNKKTLLVLGAVIVVLLLVLVFAGDKENANDTGTEDQLPGSNENVDDILDDDTGTANIVTYSDAGYVPSELTVEKGALVIFKNEGAKEMWPATAKHPEHTVYPNSDIKKCGTEAAGVMFDACQGVSPNGSYAFRFENEGTWFFHDHLSPTFFGSIIVK